MAMPVSMTEPSLSINGVNTAYLGGNGRSVNLAAIIETAGPDIRTMPTPPFPGGVAIAAMVSLVPMSTQVLLSIFQVFSDVPLLDDRQRIVDHPVQDQTGREE